MTINSEFFDNAIAAVNGAPSCEDLQKVVSDVMPSLDELKDSITAELAKYQPMLALLVVPGANLGQIVTWIRNFVEGFLTPITAPAIAYQLELAELTAKISELTSAINSAKNKFTDCSISI